MVKDLSAFATPSLDVSLGEGRRVSIMPPSVENGARLAAMTTIGAAVASGDVSDEAAQMFTDTLQDVDDEQVKRLAVGDAYDRMLEDGWAYPDIELVCRYATFYWVYGESIADQILEAELEQRSGKQPSGKSPGRGKSGRRTA